MTIISTYSILIYVKSIGLSLIHIYIKLGDVLNPNKKITRNYLGVSLYKIIQDAYTRASDSNNVQYQVVFDGEKLCVRTRGNRDKSSPNSLIAAELSTFFTNLSLSE